MIHTDMPAVIVSTLLLTVLAMQIKRGLRHMQTCIFRYKGILCSAKRHKYDKKPWLAAHVASLMHGTKNEKHPQNNGAGR